MTLIQDLEKEYQTGLSYAKTYNYDQVKIMLIVQELTSYWARTNENFYISDYEDIIILSNYIYQQWLIELKNRNLSREEIDYPQAFARTFLEDNKKELMAFFNDYNTITF